MESRCGSKRVEQRGRFTITEIIPGSPLSPPAAVFVREGEEGAMSPEGAAEPEASENKSPLRPEELESAPVADSDAPEAPPAHDAQPLPAREEAASLSGGLNNDVPVAHATIPESPALVPQADPAVVATEPSSQDDSSPERQTQYKRLADRRRKGRFTIIELASDSPTSRKASDEFDGTTPPTARFTRSFTATATSSKKLAADKHHYRVARSMTRLREPHVTRRSRLRSESPMRANGVTMSVGSGISSRSSVGGFESHAYGARIPLLERNMSSQSMLGSSQIPSDASMLSMLPQQEALAPAAAIPAQSPLATTVPVSPALSASRSSASFFANGEANAAARGMQQQQPATADAGQNVDAQRHAGALQNTITISAAQFLQQQQTIASLIRQQHDLKQIIAVLHEQQQQLMTIPMQLSELKRKNTQGDARDEETRELYLQLDTLSRTNESLQTLLSQTEQDANLRGLEIDCLSEENDELRRRCAQLEARYIAERKQSFILEEELQRLRMMTLNHELQERLTNTGVSEGEA